MPARLSLSLLACAGVLLVAPRGDAIAADSGLYVGGSVGSAGIELDFVESGFDLPEFDEDDFAWKVFGGYNVDLIAFDVGVEAGYVDFGQPSASIFGVDLELDPTGFTVFGVAGFDLGPVGVFGKLGYVAWDLEATVDGVSVDDDGSDLAYGAGLRFNVGSIEIRGEYEVYDVDDTDRVGMASAGIVYFFN